MRGLLMIAPLTVTLACGELGGDKTSGDSSTSAAESDTTSASVGSSGEETSGTAGSCQVQPDVHPCQKEEQALQCCELAHFSDEPWSGDCLAHFEKLAEDAQAQHCVMLYASLLECSAALECDELAEYAEANSIDAVVQDFVGVPCGDAATALLEADCELLGTAAD